MPELGAALGAVPRDHLAAGVERLEAQLHHRAFGSDSVRNAGGDVDEVAGCNPEVQHVRVAELDEAVAAQGHHQ